MNQHKTIVLTYYENRIINKTKEIKRLLQPEIADKIIEFSQAPNFINNKPLSKNRAL